MKIQTRKETMSIGKGDLEARFMPKTLDKEARTVEVVFSTGARVRRFSFWEGSYEEELSLKRSHVRLERLNAGAAVLNNHSAYSLRDVIGVVEKASIRKNEKTGENEALATLRLSGREDVAPIIQDIEDGVLRNISVGYRVHKMEERSEGEGDEKKRILRATDWEPMEISFVAIPADSRAQVRSDDSKEYPCEITFNEGAEEMKTPKKDLAPDNTRLEEDQKAAIDAATKRAVEDERKRVEEITEAVRAASLDASVADELVKSGVSADQARKDILKRLSEKAKEEPKTVSINIEVTDNERDLMVEGSVNAILNRYDAKKYELTDNGRRFRGLSLKEMAQDCLAQKNVSTRGMDMHTLWNVSMNLDRRGGYQSTSDFPEILANVANKTLRDSYSEAPQTFMPFTREVEVPDFKQISRTQLGDAPNLLETPEHAEVKRGKIGEAAEKYEVKTYERIVAVTRKALINDDLDAFTRIPALMGRAARDLESDTVWSIILTNASMGDGNALFSAAHSNVFGAAGNPIDVANVGQMRAAMRNQKGLNGRLMNLRPSYLVVPSELETSAEQFTGAINPDSSGNVNPFSGRLNIIAEPRLADASLGAEAATNVWYLFTDVGQIDMIELAKLSGMREPSMSTREGWDVEGMEIKVLLDLGAKAIDWRGMSRRKV